MGKRFSHATAVTSARQRLEAIAKYVTDRKLTIPVGGKLLKPAQVAAIFQESLDTQAAVAQKRAAYQGAITARDAAEARRLVADEAMKNWVLQLYADGSTEASEFGYSARKKPQVSAEVRARAVELNRATRHARGTIGKKQKLKIHGVVPSRAVEPESPHSGTTSSAPSNGSDD